MPQKFFFGAATSSHQVEGNTDNNWAEWEKQNAARLAAEARGKLWDDHILAAYPNPFDEENYISGRAAGHYHRFREDFDIAKSLGHNAHRFSLEWSRLEPEEGRFDEKEFDHYREVIRALRERGMEPFVTLWHWTLPRWLSEKGGVLSKKFPEYFRRFARKAADAYRGEVRFWMTVNEPEVFSSNSYYRGKWPPQRHSLRLAFKSIRALTRAHTAAYREIKALDRESRVGPVMDMVHFESAGGPLNHFLKWLADHLWNYYFLNRVLPTADFIGVNYYFHHRINRSFHPRNANERVSDLLWELYPEGLYHVLMDLRKFALPVYITENGLADVRDAHREFFLTEHIRAMRRAMADGADVRGYFHWSLLDNFEWDSGFWPRFGLVEVDYQTFERRIRPSALAYKRLIGEWHNKETNVRHDIRR